MKLQVTTAGSKIYAVLLQKFLQANLVTKEFNIHCEILKSEFKSEGLKYQHNKNFTERVLFLLDTYNLLQISDFPVRTSLASISLIDSFFLGRSNHKEFQFYLAINGLSDHDG
jgi:hypothetical protein